MGLGRGPGLDLVLSFLGVWMTMSRAFAAIHPFSLLVSGCASSTASSLPTSCPRRDEMLLTNCCGELMLSAGTGYGSNLGLEMHSTKDFGRIRTQRMEKGTTDGQGRKRYRNHTCRGSCSLSSSPDLCNRISRFPPCPRACTRVQLTEERERAGAPRARTAIQQKLSGPTLGTHVE